MLTRLAQASLMAFPARCLARLLMILAILLGLPGLASSWQNYGLAGRPGRIGVGLQHMVALKGDGSVVAWGDDTYHQTELPAGALSRVAAVAAGGLHTVALKSDGTVIAWGDNRYGQSTVPPGLVTIPAGNPRVTAIAAGDFHSVAMLSDGTVVAWGYNFYGQTTVPAALGGVISIAAGANFTLALKGDGSIVHWGDNSASQKPDPSLKGFTAIAAGAFHSVALNVNGTVSAWGDPSFNTYGQATVPGGLSGVIAIAAGSNHTLALKDDGSMFVWGSNGSGQATIPAAGQSGVVAIAARSLNSLALKSDGSVVAWGDDSYAQTDVPTQWNLGIAAFAGGGSHTLALKSNGAVLTWGYDSGNNETKVPSTANSGAKGVTGTDNNSVALMANGTELHWGNLAKDTPTITGSLTAVAAGLSHLVVLRSDGTVFNWGDNGQFQLNFPNGVAPTGVTSIAAGNFHSLALKSDGSVVAWGDNGYGQTAVPASLPGVSAIAANGNASMALVNNGSVVGWGSFLHLPFYVDQAAQRGVKAIAVGLDHAAALLDNGSVIAWGDDSQGQTEVPVAALSDVVAISADDDATVALRSDGSLVTWGSMSDTWLLPPTTAIGLSSNLNPAGSGQSVTLTATVTGYSSPLGTVTFLDGQAVLGTATPNASGIASFSLPTNLALGGHALRALYTGDATRLDSYSTVLTQTVQAITSISSLARQAPAAALTNAASVTFRATFAAGVTGVSAGNFDLNPAPTGASISGVAVVAGSSNTQWDIAVNTGSADGTLGLRLVNSTGLSLAISTTLPFAGQSYTIDKTPPTIVISAPSSSATPAGPVTYTVTYADSNLNAATLSAGNITVTKTGSASCSSPQVSGSSPTYTVSLGGLTGTGTLGISIAAGTASDLAGNLAPASGPSGTFSVNNPPPTITSASSRSFAVGTFGTFTVTTTGYAVAVSLSGALPSGVTFTDNFGTATLSGTPAAGTSGSYPLTFTASNGSLPNATQNFTLTVGQAPAITSLFGASFTAGSPSTFTVRTTGFPAPALSMAGSLPSGVSFVDNGDGTATLAGTPAAGSNAAYTFTITASNGFSPNASQFFTLTLFLAPAIPSATIPGFIVGSVGSYTITASGNPTPTVSLTGGTLPTGVTLASNGTLSGTPAAGTSGHYSFTVTASNGVQPDASQSFTLTVNQVPAITSAAGTTFMTGSHGSFTVTSTGVPVPSLTRTGTLPGGVIFLDNGNGTATLSGTPAGGTGGSYAITVTASNGVGSAASQSFTLTVNQAPGITTPSSTTFLAGGAGSFSMTASGYPAPTFSVSAGSLPSGVTLASNGTLSGTPAAGSGGSYPFTVTASNGISPNATQGFTLTVNQAPAITSANTAAFTVGSAGTFSVTSTGFPAAGLSRNGTLPNGVSLTDNGNGTATLSGTPASGSGGSYPITLTAGNGVGTAATQSFTLTVTQAPAITSGTAATFTAGSAGTFTVTSTGTPVASLSAVGTLPSGVTFADNGNGTGTLAGTPAAGTGKVYPITFSASNGTGSPATQAFTLTVDQAPAITSANAATFTAGSAGSFTVTSTGFPAAALTKTGALPNGVSLVDNGNGTATLSGTPASGTGGSYPITLSAGNGVATAATQSFTLTVDQAPAITSANAATFTVASAGTFSVTSTGFPVAALTKTGSLPSGVTLTDNGNGSATLAGTPGTGTGGSYALTLTAGNGIGANTSQSFTLTVNQAPAITSANAATFTAGSAGTFTVTSTGYPAAALTRTGTLPSGVTLVDNGNGTATLAGTPAAGSDGVYSLTFTGNNGVGPNASQSFTLSVGTPASITGQPVNATVTAGGNTSFTVAGTGSITGYRWQVNTGSGFSPISDGGLYLGAGTATLKILGATADLNGFKYQVYLFPVGAPPVISNTVTLTVDTPAAITSQPSDVRAAIGGGASFQVVATGMPAPSYRWQRSSDGGGTWIDVTGATLASFTLTPVALTDNGARFRVVVGNGIGSPVTSEVARLMVGTVANDFNGDGTSDLLWRNSANGWVFTMPMANGQPQPGAISWVEPDPAWQIVASADLDGDGKADQVWWNSTTGQVFAMLMDGTTVRASGQVYQEPDTTWRIVAAADFAGTGRASLLWRNSTTGLVYLMPMNGLGVQPGGIIWDEPDAAWQIVAAADFDGDGKAEILWQNKANGLVFLMKPNGTGLASGSMIYYEPDLDWKIVGAGDFGGTGTSGILWRHKSNGQVYVLPMAAGAPQPGGVVWTEASPLWQIKAIGDFDGDGKADIMWWNSSTGQLFQVLLNGAAMKSAGYVYLEPNTAWTLEGGGAMPNP